ncbi:MAG: hypothetical protein KAR35_04265 [Candidatus Heimdallarchaeota archaeon]|nr:hypothetical protein [Candidatus Heimdallarchaeota archaeon]MCK5048569.1 hypothetical protein [Candidatus Heimdallarchaeota archaeon]
MIIVSKEFRRRNHYLELYLDDETWNKYQDLVELYGDENHDAITEIFNMAHKREFDSLPVVGQNGLNSFFDQLESVIRIAGFSEIFQDDIWMKLKDIISLLKDSPRGITGAISRIYNDLFIGSLDIIGVNIKSSLLENMEKTIKAAGHEDLLHRKPPPMKILEHTDPEAIDLPISNAEEGKDTPPVQEVQPPKQAKTKPARPAKKRSIPSDETRQSVEGTVQATMDPSQFDELRSSLEQMNLLDNKLDEMMKVMKRIARTSRQGPSMVSAGRPQSRMPDGQAPSIRTLKKGEKGDAAPERPPLDSIIDEILVSWDASDEESSAEPSEEE